jgi:hypothetical protein
MITFLARYLQNGQIVDVEENGGLLEATRPMDFLPGFSLEGENSNLLKIFIQRFVDYRFFFTITV